MKKRKFNKWIETDLKDFQYEEISKLTINGNTVAELVKEFSMCIYLDYLLITPSLDDSQVMQILRALTVRPKRAWCVHPFQNGMIAPPPMTDKEVEQCI